MHNEFSTCDHIFYRFILVGVLFIGTVHAQNINSTNYTILDPKVDSGTGESSSTNYKTLTQINNGVEGNQLSSSLYSVKSGNAYTFMANVPKVYLFSKSDISCTATLINKATIPLSYDFIAKTAPIFPITGEAVTTRIDSGIVMFPAQTKKISFKVPTTNSLLGKNQLTFQIVSTNEFLPAALVNSTNYTYYYVSAILVGICIPLGGILYNERISGII